MKKQMFIVMMLVYSQICGMDHISIRPGFDLKATKELFKAVQANDRDLIEEKISRTGDIKFWDFYDMNIAQAAIQAGADVNAYNTYNRETPLMRAIDAHIARGEGSNAPCRSKKELIELLIEKGAYLEFMDIEGQTPLHYAARWGAGHDIIALLINHGAQVNVQDSQGFSPLHRAVQHDHENIVKLLLANGANLNCRTESGDTPLTCAISGKNKDIALLLIRHGALGANIFALAEKDARYHQGLIDFFDEVVQEINKERLQEEERLFAWSHLRAKNTSDSKKNINSAILARLHKQQIPLPSEELARIRKKYDAAQVILKFFKRFRENSAENSEV